MPNLTERYLLPAGERRVVDAEVAARLRAVVSRAALDLGLDKVTAAVVLADYAVELMATNRRPAYGPPEVREMHERAIVVHFGARFVGPDIRTGRA